MAIGLVTDLKVFPDQFYAGFNEISALNSNQFNALSNNTLRLFPGNSAGLFIEEAFWKKSVSTSRLNTASVTAQTPDPLAAGSFIKPTLLRKVDEVANTVAAMRLAGQGMSMDEVSNIFSFTLGQQVAKAVLDDYMNSAVLGLVTATNKQAATRTSLLSDATTTLTSKGLIKGLQKFGDRGSDIRAWVMHSKAFYDLMANQSDVASDVVGGATIYQGSVGGIGRPVIVVDSPFLVKADGVTTGVDSYYTLGLREGAADVIDTQNLIFNTEWKNGLEQIYMSFQAEFGYNIGVAGYSYTGTANNPDNTAFGNASNWTLAIQAKWSAGVAIESA